MARPELATEFATMTERMRRRDRIVGEWVGRFDAPEVLARLDAAEVPCSVVNSVRDLFADARRAKTSSRWRVRSAACWPCGHPVPKLSLTPGTIDGAGPVAVGEHNEEIYCGRLGLTRDDLAALRARGIV